MLKDEGDYFILQRSSFKDHEFHSPEEMWYSLLTKEEYYNQLLTLNEYALRFLPRTSNECIVESQVSSIENIQTSSRHLKHEMGERLSFIKTNGPHPHSSLSVYEDAVDKHFYGKRWHFVLMDSTTTHPRLQIVKSVSTRV